MANRMRLTPASCSHTSACVTKHYNLVQAKRQRTLWLGRYGKYGVAPAMSQT